MPVSLERRDYRTACGVLVLAVGTVFTLGVGLVLLVAVFRGVIDQSLISDHRAVVLLLLLIALAPIQALEDLLVGVLGVLARPRTIFVRTYILAPSFRLVVGVLLILTKSSVYFLAAGYVTSAGVGLAISAFLLFRVLRAEGLLEHFSLRTMRIPARETFAFTLPLLSIDLVNVLLFSSDAVLLGHFQGPAEVASFRVIVPLAALTVVPASVFTLLYVPVASRLFARGDRAGINDLYRRTTLWIAVVCFPAFALTWSAAGPLTSLLYGPRYAHSAVFLSTLAIGYYVQAAFGFNGLTLMVFGRVRAITVLNVLAMVFNIAINLVLIPRHGALGAAIGTTGTLIVHNVLKQVALRRVTGVGLLAPGSRRPFAMLAGVVAGLLLVYPLVRHHATIGLVVALLAVALVLLMTRRSLEVAGTFPELARIPGVGRFFAAGDSASAPPGTSKT